MNTQASHRPRVLFLAHRVPFPPDKGDRIRSWNLLRYLSQHYDVWLGCLADEDWSSDTERALREVCSGMHIARLDYRRWLSGMVSLAAGSPITLGMFSSMQLRNWIRRTAREVRFDAAIAYCSSMAPYVAVPELRGIPLIVDLVDVDSQKWQELSHRSAWPQRTIYRWESRRLRYVERDLGRRAEAVTLVTAQEADLYRQHAPEARISVLENGVATEFFRRPQAAPPPAREIVFVGALDYRPNADGVCWFVTEVWPRILREVPEAVLRIVGRNPGRVIRAVASQPGVQVHANVPDVRPYLFGARVAIAPLHVARGVQNKILEALACETPVIASPEALAGTRLSPGHEVLVAQTGDEWVTAAVALLRDEALSRHLSANGRRFVLDHCNWNRQLSPLGQLLDGLMCDRASVTTHRSPPHVAQIGS